MGSLREVFIARLLVFRYIPVDILLLCLAWLFYLQCLCWKINAHFSSITWFCVAVSLFRSNFGQGLKVKTLIRLQTDYIASVSLKFTSYVPETNMTQWQNYLTTVMFSRSVSCFEKRPRLCEVEFGLFTVPSFLYISRASHTFD